MDDKITADFGAQAAEAFKLIDTAITNNAQLNDPRTIRCLVFLSDKKIEGLKHLLNLP